MIKHLKIYYDGSCHLCQNYVKFLRLKSTVERVELVNLRTSEKRVQDFNAMGMDVDQGMIVDIDGETHFGDKAIFVLAGLSSQSNLWNRINAWLFASGFFTRLLYPFMRLFRNTLLFAQGTQKLNASPQQEDLSLFKIFTLVWGLLGFLHFVVYFTQFDAPIFPTTIVIPILGIILALKVGSKRIFALLCVVMIIDGWLQMPSLSNHTILKNFFLLALMVSALWHGLKGSSWRLFFADLAIAGRFLLLTMYIFGVFHKINADFINPETSCAVALWEAMPFPFHNIDARWFAPAAIYGTYVAELAILGLLLYKPLRDLGVFLGIVFHSLLALSGYAFYPPFSTLTIALHVLFLGSSARHIASSREWLGLEQKLTRPFGVSLLLVYCGSVFLLAWLGQYSLAAYVWLWAVVIFACLLFINREKAASRGQKWTRLFSSNHGVTAVVLLFFFNCTTPYLGLKTAQSINMFANLRLEAGQSNHLILRNAPRPFDYLEGVVEITGSTGYPYFNYIQQENLRLTYYDFLSRIEAHRHITVSYIKDGTSYTHYNYEQLQQDIEATLHPRWVRKWFHFNPVDLTAPKACALNR